MQIHHCQFSTCVEPGEVDVSVPIALFIHNLVVLLNHKLSACFTSSCLSCTTTHDGSTHCLSVLLLSPEMYQRFSCGHWSKKLQPTVKIFCASLLSVYIMWSPFIYICPIYLFHIGLIWLLQITATDQAYAFHLSRCPFLLVGMGHWFWNCLKLSQCIYCCCCLNVNDISIEFMPCTVSTMQLWSERALVVGGKLGS